VTAPAKVVAIHDTRQDRASEVARAILAGFDKHYRLFREAAREAKGHFESARWGDLNALSRERIELYDRRVQETVEAVLARFPEAETDEGLWPAIKLAYIPLLHEHRQPECAETFYNSVACAVLHRRYYRNEFIFWRPAVATEHLEARSRPTAATTRVPGRDCARLSPASCATTAWLTPSRTCRATSRACCARCALTSRARRARGLTCRSR